MKVLALDFDGVLIDSQRETFLVALRTYVALKPESALAATLAALGPPPTITGKIERDQTFLQHRSLSPLGNRAEDFGAALAAIDEGVEIRSQEEYDRFRASLDSAWLRTFHKRFYEERRRLHDECPAAWLRLQPPYRSVLGMLRRRADSAALSIVTAKDGAAVRLLLAAHEADGLVPSDLVLDKECGTSKRAHLTLLRRRLSVSFHEITFVDDKLNHLLDVEPLGVRCVLAGWGHNSEREHRQARKLGFPVATLETAEQLLFGA